MKYPSCRALCAPSDPAPIALASKRKLVPEGSTWKLWTGKGREGVSFTKEETRTRTREDLFLQMRTLFVSPSDEKCNPKWPTHDRLLTSHTLTKAQGKIAHRLSDALHFHWLIISEFVALLKKKRKIFFRSLLKKKEGIFFFKFFFFLIITKDSALAWSMSVLESAVSPEVAKPTWVSTLKIFSMLEGSSRGDVILFSTARTTPSAVWIPIAVDPSWAAMD